MLEEPTQPQPQPQPQPRPQPWLLWLWPLCVLGILNGTLLGCAHVDYRADFDSKVRHEALPLRATVTVLLDPQLRRSWDEDDLRLEQLRESFSDALKKDLRKNGPITPVESSPAARLEVILREVDDADRKYYFMMWFFAPVWLFGVPYHGVALDLAVDVRLYSARGGSVFESNIAADCAQLEGLYYGRDNLTFGCAAKKVSEALRERLSIRRASILAGIGPLDPDRDRGMFLAPPESSGRKAQDRPSLVQGQNASRAQGSFAPSPSATEAAEVADAGKTVGSARVDGADASPPQLEAPPRDRPVAAVFLIRDMSGRFSRSTMEQLTEFLAVKVTEDLGFRVVPRDLVRETLATSKADSYKACFDDSCQIELGKALAANKSVSTTLIQIGERCVFNATVYDLRSEAAEYAAASETDCNENALLDGVRAVVSKLRAGAS
ncbi:MAG: hypothetical protein IPK13_09030 [Deltaproteobacteria bacterium]|nr:hypothetical protein [Deltaproteobacteria bacterium]